PLLELPHGSTQGECSSKPVPAYLKRWRQFSELKLLFWRKWSRDYLFSQQQRGQWSKGEANLVEGTVVLVHDDNSPPQRWIIGRVTRAIAGEDGKVRVAEIKTAAGVIKRPVSAPSKLLKTGARQRGRNVGVN
ncbi:hypothetical protein ACLKA7_005230, partial [Drosophila subpalustris]